MKRPPITIPILLIGLISVSFAAIFIKLIGSSGPVHPIVIAAWRLIMTAVVIIPLGTVVLRGRLWTVMKKHGLILGIGGILLGLHFILWIASLNLTSVASSVVIVCMNPIWVGLASHFVLKERPGRHEVIGIVLAVAGAVIIGWGDFSVSHRALLGDLLALGGSFLMSGYMLLGRRVRVDVSLLEYITPIYTVAALAVAPFALVMDLPLGGYSGKVYLLLAALAIIPQLIGHTSFNWALRYVTATIVAVTILGEPVIATVLAYFILHESVTAVVVAGGIITLIGIGVVLAKSGNAHDE
ncbi:MAG: DMT family transporter [Deltaproteobacteria bacterium]|nr:DMT family transporter [Candidatus Zymogenaceae bacterium]